MRLLWFIFIGLVLYFMLIVLINLIVLGDENMKLIELLLIDVVREICFKSLFICFCMDWRVELFFMYFLSLSKFVFKLVYLELWFWWRIWNSNWDLLLVINFFLVFCRVLSSLILSIWRMCVLYLLEGCFFL